MSQAPLTGSRIKLVPGTLTPFLTFTSSAKGPSIFLQSSKVSARRPQPNVSIKQYLAVSMARSLNSVSLCE